MQDFFITSRALKGSNGHLCRKALLIPPLAHQSNLNGCGLCDWPKVVFIDPTQPTPEGLALCSVILPKVRPEHQKHPANQNQPWLKAATIAFMVIYSYFSYINSIVYDYFYFLDGRFFIKTRFFVFAGCHKDVVKIVELACKHNVCLIPYGGELRAHLTSKQNVLLHTVHYGLLFI